MRKDCVTRSGVSGDAVRCLVRRGDDIVGVLRLADVFDAVVDSLEAGCLPNLEEKS